MIKTDSYSKNWILDLRKKQKKIDPIICEKMIRALGLLEMLKLNGLNFIFKGGTSLILLIDDPQRFSIDIDINIEESKESITDILIKICSEGLFIRFEEDVRTGNNIPKQHFKLFYNSVISEKETYVLLDVLFEKNLYPVVKEVKILSKWINTDSNLVNVSMPSIDSILGDKLTAFAPTTSGIPHNTGKSMEIIKQLFDIDRLFDIHNDLVIIAESFQNIGNKQLKYRDLNITVDKILDDIIETSLIISHFPAGNTSDSLELKELFDGLRRFSSYPINVSYRADDAILSASKAALLAIKIKNNDFRKIELFSETSVLTDFEFPNEFKHLYKLRKRKREAYFYWVQFFECYKNVK
ncbi:MAG TPA: nucleotidyl transferase AbiEii/AbiGii toxin family protein [Clostridiales bacterium]|nr:nucleotidyl transferase AbiEii/AbiGii toxin family protein [Clostridiales bacterium]HQP69176.1 nucleotidyl transferase AbiEii/AbiGii toxin family protein [Clostridiales bacterium]